jgi:hypothetical protein
MQQLQPQRRERVSFEVFQATPKKVFPIAARAHFPLPPALFSRSLFFMSDIDDSVRLLDDFHFFVPMHSPGVTYWKSCKRRRRLKRCFSGEIQ